LEPGAQGDRVTNETDSFIQEVDERVREDKVLAFFKRWGVLLAIVVGAGILGIGAWQWWQANQISTARSQADAYAAAQQLARDGNLDDAKTAFENLSNEGPRAYRVMAQMERAAVLEAQGDLQGALTGFDAAAEAASDPIMQRTAQMRAAYIVALRQSSKAAARSACSRKSCSRSKPGKPAIWRLRARRSTRSRLPSMRQNPCANVRRWRWP
jgi:hypothetical protein